MEEALELNPMNSEDHKVPVVYYLSRNGFLEHPHLMEIPLVSGKGLYLRDVISRLNFLRGKGMVSMYSWASKRRYRNGFVWQDLCEGDFIYPAHGLEYVLKGSQLLPILNPSPSWSPEKKPPVWTSFDLFECKANKVDAATQTDNDDKRPLIGRRPQPVTGTPSPPPVPSSSLGSLIRADGRRNGGIGEQGNGVSRSGRMRASWVLMHVISCGSAFFKEEVCRGRERSEEANAAHFFPPAAVEDKGYFSGSFIETKRKSDVFPALKRSNSYNDRPVA